MIAFQKVRILIIMILMHGNFVLMAQNRFVSIADFENSLKDSNLNSLAVAYDFLKIMLLDSSKEGLLFDYDPEIKELFSEYKKSMQLSKETVGFATDKADIKQVFNEPERIFQCVYSNSVDLLFNFKIDQPIYIHDNKAIFEILSPTTSDVYYLRIYNGIVQINWLGGIIE